MGKLLFGIIWTAFMTPIYLMCLIVPGEERGGIDMNAPLFIFLTIFELIGIYMIFVGIKKLIKDKKTDLYGLECYGIIRNILPTGVIVNNKPEYKAIIEFVNPETYETEDTEEIIGFDYNKYTKDFYVLCKYYEGDINLGSIIYDNEEVPTEIKNKLKLEENPNSNI